MSSLNEILVNFNRLLILQYHLAKSLNNSIQAKDASGNITTVNRQMFDQLVGNVYQQVKKISIPPLVKSVIIYDVSENIASTITTGNDYSSLVKRIFREIRAWYDNIGRPSEGEWVVSIENIKFQYKNLEQQWLDYFAKKKSTELNGITFYMSPPNALQVYNGVFPVTLTGAVRLEESNIYSFPNHVTYLIALNPWDIPNRWYIIDAL